MKLYCECEVDFIEDYEKIADKVIRTVFEKYPCPFETELSLYIVDAETIREANASQRGIDRVTDVLSFPNLPFTPECVADFSMIDPGDPDCFDPESGALCLGEVMICAEKVKEQAENYGHSRILEFAFLLAHSLLHLLGWDHEEEADRLRMEEEQEQILKEAGYERTCDSKEKE